MSEKQNDAQAGRDKLEAQIKSADMTDDMQQESIEVAQEAMAKFTIEKVGQAITRKTRAKPQSLMSLEQDIAQHIKRTFDDRKGPTWHCIVGRNFGSFVTHGELSQQSWRLASLPTSSPMYAANEADMQVRGIETKHFIYFYLGHCAILLFKTQ